MTTNRADTPSSALADLIAELGELPDGLASHVRADLLLADVLRALRWSEAAVAAVVGDGPDRLEGAPVRLAGRAG
ncbi:MAG TPA: hypothetical protein VGM69_20985 [Chloroflexota bacterium]